MPKQRRSNACASCVSSTSLNKELRLRWSEIGGQQQLSTPADVERVLTAIREQLLAAVAEQQTVILE